MFAPHCSHCGGRVLLGPRRIIGIDDEGEGRRRVTLRCYCGTAVAEQLVGRHRSVA